MPKVLRIINRFNLGGPTYNVAYLTKYLEPDYETLLVGGVQEKNEGSSLFITENLGLNPVVIPELSRAINIKNDYKAYLKIKQLIREFKPDIVHTHASKAGFLGRLAAFRCGVPIVVHTFHGHVFHSYFGKVKTTIYKALERYLAKKSTVVIAISELQKKEICNEHKIVSEKKVRVIPLGFDLTRFFENQETLRKTYRTHYNINDDQLAIGIIGRLAPIKNHRLFIDAVKFVKTHSDKSIRAFIIGDGDTRIELENYITSLGLSFSWNPTENVDITFTSWITDIERPLAGLEIVCLTSFNEGTPVSLIEAQVAGKPIVTTNVGGIADILHPQAGLLSEVENTADFCKNLLQVINSESFREGAIDFGRSWVKEKFHYTRLISNMDKLYKELLSKN